MVEAKIGAIGIDVRYNGTHSLDHKIRKLIEDNNAIPVCPELLGGFSTPREPAEIIGGNGEDVLDGKAKVVEKSGSIQALKKSNLKECNIIRYADDRVLVTLDAMQHLR